MLICGVPGAVAAAPERETVAVDRTPFSLLIVGKRVVGSFTSLAMDSVPV